MSSSCGQPPWVYDGFAAYGTGKLVTFSANTAMALQAILTQTLAPQLRGRSISPWKILLLLSLCHAQLSVSERKDKDQATKYY